MPRLSKIGAAALAAFGWTSGSSVTADLLVVAGGGGGGGVAGDTAGGGGGGGYSEQSARSLNPTLSYTVTVGAGGAGGVNVTNNGQGVSGGNSVFDTITSNGGGGGGGDNNTRSAALTGGSGGGASFFNTGAAATQGNSGGATGYGNAGGNGSSTGGGGAGARGGGGGGGAGGVGSNGTTTVGGDGGAGRSSSITGSSVSRGGGGGGGAGGDSTGRVPGTGQGGGGNGSNTANASNGTANTGGGGGGAGRESGGPFTGGNGGSGVVIISYVGAQQFGGGVVTSSGGNTIHTFNTSGTLSPLSSLTASYLIVAGGGGSGANNGAGGGAGGMLTGSGLTIDTNSTYLVTVGSGGAGTASTSVTGSNGTNSTFSIVSTTAVGGGGGGGSAAAGANGGSGGGGGNAAGGSAFGTGTAGQGNNGGAGFQDAPNYAGGGGGGAGAVGGSAGSGSGSGVGGIGLTSSISGTSTYYAGGGGGGQNTGTAGAGGLGGGGAGSVLSPGTSGTANTGGGGGGAGGSNLGGAGGSGIVIISYPGSTQQMAGGTVTVAGGNVIHTFTSSGYLTPIVLVNNSLRFRSSASAYLNRTQGTSTNQSIGTWSFWFKRGTLGTAQRLFEGYTASSDTGNGAIEIGADNLLYVGGWSTNWRITTQVFRDPSAWYHMVVTIDTTQATANNRIKVYVNGTEITAFNTTNNPTQNSTFGLNNNSSVLQIGRRRNVSSNDQFFDGYLADVNFVDGQALTPNSFGTSNGLGVWQPIRYGGSYGNNGFYLPFTNTTSTTTLGYDFSPNGNNWTTNNISLTAGTTYDSMTDVPTLTSATAANYAVLNPLAKNSSNTVSNGNLSASGNVIYGHVQSTIFASSGKFYFEAQLTTQQNDTAIGLGNTNSNPQNNYTGESTNSVGYLSDGRFFYNGSSVATYSSYTTGDTVACAFDCATGNIWIAKNNTWQNSGNPAAGTGSVQTVSWTEFTGLARTVGSGAISINYGQQPFAYTPPSGFVALNTFNLPTPTIGATASTTANKYFDVTLYTGTGATQTITNSGSMQPDFLWLKQRGNASSHCLTDNVRGVNSQLISNSTDAQYTATDCVTAINSNGFTLGANTQTAPNVNFTVGGTFVGWQWKANGTGSTNTNGSIISTVSANTTAGFSIVTYTGNGANSTVGHGLGVAPSMYIVKRRNAGGDNWATYHISTGNTQFLRLDTNNAAQTFNLWQNTTPTSSVFYLTSDVGVNGSGSTYVAYCFAQVAGYSAFGSYTGNGSSDGPFIFTGFRPRYVMIKNTSAISDWWVEDTSRAPYNAANALLFPNLNIAEYTTAGVEWDLLSNGFKIRNTATQNNTNGSTYIYMAFAENPFKYANAR